MCQTCSLMLHHHYYSTLLKQGSHLERSNNSALIVLCYEMCAWDDSGTGVAENRISCRKFDDQCIQGLSLFDELPVAPKLREGSTKAPQRDHGGAASNHGGSTKAP